jgi:hypothetical protein
VANAFLPGQRPIIAQNIFCHDLIYIEQKDACQEMGADLNKNMAGLGDLPGGYLMGADPADIDRVQSLLKQAGFWGCGSK